TQTRSFTLVAEVGTINRILIAIYRKVSPQRSPQTGTMQSHDVFRLAIYICNENRILVIGSSLHHIGGKSVTFYFFTIFIYQKCFFDQLRILSFGYICRNRHVDGAQDLLSLVVFLVFLLESSKRLRSKGQHDCDQNNHYGSINNSIHVTVSVQSLFLVGSSLVFHFFEIGSGSCTYRTNIRSFISFVDISTYFTF